MITLHSGERILLEQRQYWLPIAAQGIVLLFLALLPIAFFLIVQFFPSLLASFRYRMGDYTVPFVFFACAWALMLWIIFAIAWTNYYLDVLVVTSKRVIDVQQIGLFARDVAELRLENIEDLRVEIIGFLPSLLGFGNVHIQTAGELREFVIRNMHDPHVIRDLISRCHDEAVQKS